MTDLQVSPPQPPQINQSGKSQVLTVEQASLYQSIVDDMMEKIENSEGIERPETC
jgi:hypothetical protein